MVKEVNLTYLINRGKLKILLMKGIFKKNIENLIYMKGEKSEEISKGSFK